MKPAKAVAVVAILFAIQIIIRFRSELVSDAAWYLYVADGLLHGKTLYQDFIEVNPPLGIWLTVPIVWFANVTSLSPIAAMWLSMFVLIALSLMFINRYLRIGALASENARAYFVIATAAALLFLPTEDFAEREHFMVLLFLPWVFLRLTEKPAGRIGNAERFVVGLCAGAAICLKPQAIGAPIFVELVLLYQRRNLTKLLSPENIGAVCFALSYAAAIYFFTPLYIMEIIGLATKAYLPYGGESALAIFYMVAWALAMLAVAISLRWIKAKSNQNTLLLDVLLAASVGFLLSYFVQGKGFFYQCMPINIFIFMACSRAAISITLTSGKLNFPITIYAVLSLAFVYQQPQSYDNIGPMFGDALAAAAPDAKSIFIATTRIDHPFPFIVKKHLHWASRLPYQLLIPYVVEKGELAISENDPVRTKAIELTVTDLANFKPDIVFIVRPERQAHDPGGPFDYLKFWSADPRFVDIWKNYHLKTKNYGFDVYVLAKP